MPRYKQRMPRRNPKAKPWPRTVRRAARAPNVGASVGAVTTVPVPLNLSGGLISRTGRCQLEVFVSGGATGGFTTSFFNGVTNSRYLNLQDICTQTVPFTSANSLSRQYDQFRVKKVTFNYMPYQGGQGSGGAWNENNTWPQLLGYLTDTVNQVGTTASVGDLDNVKMVDLADKFELSYRPQGIGQPAATAITQGYPVPQKWFDTAAVQGNIGYVMAGQWQTASAQPVISTAANVGGGASSVALGVMTCSVDFEFRKAI